MGVLLLGFAWFLLATRSTEYDTFDGVNHGVSLIAWSTLMLGASFTLGAVARACHDNAWRENTCWRREQAWQAYPAVAYHVSSSIVELVFVLLITFVAAVLTFTLFGFWSITRSGTFTLAWFTLTIFALGQMYLGQWLVRIAPNGGVAAVAGVGINLLPLLTLWRGSAVSTMMSLVVSVTPQHSALQILQALVFGAAADSCIYDNEDVDQLPCRELRLIPSGEGRRYSGKLTVYTYMETEYGAQRDGVAVYLVKLAIFLVVLRFLVIMALKKRQVCA